MTSTSLRNVFAPIVRPVLRDVFPFSIDQIFSANEQGVWIDLSDTSTIFQDIAGTTRVTALGQPVGLALDKSRGLVSGPELFSNQPSVLDNSGGGATVVHTSATRTIQVTAAGTNPGYPRLQVSLSLVTGRRYVFSGRIDGDRSRVNLARLAISGGANNLAYNPATGEFSGIQQAGAAPIFEVHYNGTLTGSITIATISARELPGNHLAANSTAARGIHQVDETGRPYIAFNGVDTGYVTPTITPGTDKVQVFAGVRKLSDAARAMLVELGNNVSQSIKLEAPSVTGSVYYSFSSVGSVTGFAGDISALRAAPNTSVITGLGDISGDRATLRINGNQVAQATTDQGAGNYAANPIFVGLRGGATLPFNGRLYSLIARFGPNLDAQRIRQVENYVANQTGVIV